MKLYFVTPKYILYKNVQCQISNNEIKILYILKY